MTEPRIQYAKTADGVSIAFWSLGEGKPLVYMADPPYTHVQAEWQNAELRTLYTRLAERRTLIRYDRRGCGLSDRAPDFSLDATIRDLEAIANHLDLETFALLGFVHSGLTGIAFAAGHPERLTHLILENCYPSGPDYFKIPQVRAFFAVAESDWEMFTETLAHTALGWSAGGPARRLAAFLRDFVSPEMVMADEAARATDDVTGLLPKVRTPTLVMQHRHIQFPGLDIARQLASSIPNARLAVMEGAWLMDMDAEVRTIDEFLGEGEPAAAPLPSGTAVILFADIAGSTALTERLGDAAFRGKARELDAALRSVIRECQGTPVEGKLLGDGVLAVFTSARQAIAAALRCGTAGDDADLPLHLGIHAGDVIREENNVYGGAVNIAARISALSAPGEVLVSETVRSLARTSAGVRFEDRGEHALKGVSEPVRMWAVREGTRD